MQVHSREAEGGRNESGRTFAVGAKSFAVYKQLGIEMTGAPAVQHATHRGFIRTEKVSHGLQRRRKRHDRTHIQFPVGPPARPGPDPGTEESATSQGEDSALKHAALRSPLVVKNPV